MVIFAATACELELLLLPVWSECQGMSLLYYWSRRLSSILYDFENATLVENLKSTWEMWCALYAILIGVKELSQGSSCFLLSTRSKFLAGSRQEFLQGECGTAIFFHCCFWVSVSNNSAYRLILGILVFCHS